MNQAAKIAAYNAQLAGVKIPSTGIVCTQLADKEGTKPAPKTTATEATTAPNSKK
jgi:hypothetical protein